MTADDDAPEVAALMSPEDSETYIALRGELRTLRANVEQREGELSKLAQKYGIPGLDGWKSAPTISIRDRLGAHGLNINSWWVKTPPDWTCPICNRNKSQCARLDTKEALHGKLAQHHDHMRDYLDNALAEHARDNGSVEFTIDEHRSKTLRRFAEGLVRFDDVVICEDCNNADAAAKRRVSAPRNLTFTPAEIASFIVPTSGQPHEIDDDALRHVYGCALRMYEVRSEVVRRLCRSILADKHWHEQQRYETLADVVERRAARAKAIFGFTYRDRSDVELLLLAPQPRRAVFDTWRKKVRPTISPPSPSDIALVAASSRVWQTISEDWACPCCGRKKLDTVRPSNQHVWIFVVQDVYFIDPNSHYGKSRVLICDACNQASRDFAMEARAYASITDAGVPLLSLDELSAVLRPQPHSLHAINESEFFNLLYAVADRQVYD